jgi:hypothetical protein
MSIACNPATFSEPDRTWLGTGNMRSNTVHRHFPLSDSPLMVEIFPYPSTWPRSNLMPGQVHFHCSSHKSGNFSFRPLTQSCSLGKHYVREVTWLSRLPIFRGGEAIVMTSRQLFVYRYNPVHIWDGTSGSHDMRGPVSIASKSATFSEPGRTWLGTGNMRSNSIHRRFQLSDSPLVFEFSLTCVPGLTQKSVSIIRPINQVPFLTRL